VIAAYPLWFAGSLLAVVASGRLLLAASLEWRSVVMAWLAAGAFVLWCVLSVAFYWGAS
jgi:hypothetical protein